MRQPASQQGAAAPAHDDVKPLDPGRVNTMDPVELRYWIHELNTTETQLMRAVAEVGEHVTAVRERLSRH